MSASDREAIEEQIQRKEETLDALRHNNQQKLDTLDDLEDQINELEATEASRSAEASWWRRMVRRAIAGVSGGSQ